MYEVMTYWDTAEADPSNPEYAGVRAHMEEHTQDRVLEDA